MRWLQRICVLASDVGGRHRTALAVQPDEVLTDPALEARARVLSKELRCMVCQNQSIDDSDAPLARDLRLLVRERLTAGDSDAQVLDFLVARYGEFVLLKPRLYSAHHAALALPTAGLADRRIGAGGGRRAAIAGPAVRLRGRRGTPSSPPAEEARLADFDCAAATAKIALPQPVPSATSSAPRPPTVTSNVCYCALFSDFPTLPNFNLAATQAVMRLVPMLRADGALHCAEPDTTWRQQL